MAELTLIKLGGSVLTDKSGREALRPEVLQRLCRELAEGLPPSCVVGHGSGSFGHRAALDHGVTDGEFGVDQQAAMAATRAAALRLHEQVLGALGNVGVRVASHPSSEWCAWRGEDLKADLTAVASSLEQGAVPVVMGDVIERVEGGARIASTETVLLAVAAQMSVKRAIWVGDTDGILDSEGNTVATMTVADQPQLGAPAGADVTGGMARRWQAVRELAEHGVESILINGLREGDLRKGLAGQAVRGTRVVAEPAPGR